MAEARDALQLSAEISLPDTAVPPVRYVPGSAFIQILKRVGVRAVDPVETTNKPLYVRGLAPVMYTGSPVKIL